MIRTCLRWLLALLYGVAGILHLAVPDPFLAIMPVLVPLPEAVVALTGIAEILGALALLQPWSQRLRRAGGWALALYAICVFPANINHLLIDWTRESGGLGHAYHVPRMFVQPVLVWLALWVSGAVDWPFSDKKRGNKKRGSAAPEPPSPG